MEEFRDQDLVIVGGGDSALDWTLNLQPIAKRVTLVHRRDEFRAAPDSVNKMCALVAERRQLDFDDRPGDGAGRAAAASSKPPSSRGRTAIVEIACTRMLPFFGLTMKLGPIAEWGLEPAREPDPGRHREVRDLGIPGIFAIGDINYYPGQAEADPVRLPRGGADGAGRQAHVSPGERIVFQYTTSSTSLQKKLGVA